VPVAFSSLLAEEPETSLSIKDREERKERNEVTPENGATLPCRLFHRANTFLLDTGVFALAQ
jgi:hypothetical protein